MIDFCFLFPKNFKKLPHQDSNSDLPLPLKDLPDL